MQTLVTKRNNFLNNYYDATRNNIFFFLNNICSQGTCSSQGQLYKKQEEAASGRGNMLRMRKRQSMLRPTVPWPRGSLSLPLSTYLSTVYCCRRTCTMHLAKFHHIKGLWLTMALPPAIACGSAIQLCFYPDREPNLEVFNAQCLKTWMDAGNS